MQAAQYQPGQVLPGTVYRVVRHLATGGMGSVYDVEDTTVEKRYVLKTLHPSLVSREDLALRMRDEARSLAKLSHPNIVDVVTAGITSDAQKVPFYVMERLVGQNLRVILDKTGGLHVFHAYRIAIDVADALEHAHENNIVHRDVKPENIFLHRNANGTTTTKLLDFGIVRLLDRKANPTQGKFIGTLRYASPEQISGKTIGPSTDIYSLGLVLYELLAGRGPFDNAGDAYAIGQAHAHEPPPPLSRFVRVAPDLERLVARALAKDPKDRPADCFTFGTELRRILRSEESSPRDTTAPNVVSSTPSTVPNEPTQQGMIPPSAVATSMPDAATAAPPTEDERDAPVSPVAATVAAAADPYDRTTPSPALHKQVDRSAPTKASVPAGVKQPIAQHGTLMDDDGRASRPDPEAPVELAFPPMRAPSNTGPTAGEARSRPPERGHYFLLLASAVVSIALIGIASLFAYLRRPPPRVTAASTAAAATAPSVETPSAAEPKTEPKVDITPPPTPAAVPAEVPTEPARLARPSQRAPSPSATAKPAPSVRPAKGEAKPKAAAGSGGPTAPAVPFDP